MSEKRYATGAFVGLFFTSACFKSVNAVVAAPGSSQYSDPLRNGRSGNLIPMGARFSAPVQTGPGAQPASCTIGTGSLSRK